VNLDISYDLERYTKTFPVDELVRFDPEIRFEVIGDTSMAQYELTLEGLEKVVKYIMRKN
jgi:hypothetical protein